MSINTWRRSYNRDHNCKCDFDQPQLHSWSHLSTGLWLHIHQDSPQSADGENINFVCLLSSFYLPVSCYERTPAIAHIGKGLNPCQSKSLQNELKNNLSLVFHCCYANCLLTSDCVVMLPSKDVVEHWMSSFLCQRVTQRFCSGTARYLSGLPTAKEPSTDVASLSESSQRSDLSSSSSGFFSVHFEIMFIELKCLLLATPVMQLRTSCVEAESDVAPRMRDQLDWHQVAWASHCWMWLWGMQEDTPAVWAASKTEIQRLPPSLYSVSIIAVNKRGELLVTMAEGWLNQWCIVVEPWGSHWFLIQLHNTINQVPDRLSSTNNHLLMFQMPERNTYLQSRHGGGRTQNATPTTPSCKTTFFKRQTKPH